MINIRRFGNTAYIRVCKTMLNKKSKMEGVGGGDSYENSQTESESNKARPMSIPNSLYH